MRYRLRTLLLVLAVGSLLAVFIGIRYRERAAALEMVKKLRAEEERRQQRQRAMMFPAPDQPPEAAR